MLKPVRAISHLRAAAYGVIILAGLSMLKFGLFNLPIGIYFGIVVSVNWRVEHDGDGIPLVWTGLITMVGIFLALGASMLSRRHGVEFFNLNAVKELPRIVRATPSLASWMSIGGTFLMIEHLLSLWSTRDRRGTVSQDSKPDAGDN